MRKILKSALALGILTGVAFGGESASHAARYKTPSPEQSLFYEQLKSGQRPTRRRLLTPPQRKALDVAPIPSRKAAIEAASSYPSTAVYVTAHPDDFVLFMNPQRDVVRSDTKVVFVIVTAGDAGQGKGPTFAPYFLARENGAFRAIRFMADAWNATVSDPVSGTVRVNGHRIQRITYKNTATYFLRLPDGAGEGSGYPIHSWASLMKLQAGSISSIRAVDGSTSYTGWSDLVQTLAGIVRDQASGSPNVWLDTHEIDAAANPGDHSDHVATGSAVAAVGQLLPCVNLAYHVGYSTGGLVNLDLVDIENRSAGFANYTSGLAEKGYPGVSWEPGHMSWLAGMISRLVPTGSPNSCGF